MWRSHHLQNARSNNLKTCRSQPIVVAADRSMDAEGGLLSLGRVLGRGSRGLKRSTSKGDHLEQIGAPSTQVPLTPAWKGRRCIRLTPPGVPLSGVQRSIQRPSSCRRHEIRGGFRASPEVDRGGGVLMPASRGSIGTGAVLLDEVVGADAIVALGLCRAVVVMAVRGPLRQTQRGHCPRNSHQRTVVISAVVGRRARDSGVGGAGVRVIQGLMACSVNWPQERNPRRR